MRGLRLGGNAHRRRNAEAIRIAMRPEEINSTLSRRDNPGVISPDYVNDLNAQHRVWELMDYLEQSCALDGRGSMEWLGLSSADRAYAMAAAIKLFNAPLSRCPTCGQLPQISTSGERKCACGTGWKGAAMVKEI